MSTAVTSRGAAPAPETAAKRLRRIAGRAKRRLHYLRSGQRPPYSRAGAAVERIDDRRVVGTVTVPKGRGPVHVELFLNDVKATGTWVAMATKPAGRPNLEVREFRLTLRDIWRFARTSDRLTIKVDGRAIPIAGTRRRFIRPAANGEQAPDQLRELLAAGQVFDQHGQLRLSRTLDTEWQRKVMGLFDEVRRFVKDKCGHDLFLIYGTLLGAVREGGFIGHDIDLDTAFISSAPDGAGAAAEMRELAFALIDAGYVVEGFRAHLHVADDAGTHIDVFHLYWDADGMLAFPFGIAGTSKVSKSDWRGVTEIDFPGGRGVIPVNSEQLAEHLYGADWRTPKPGFHWPLDRTARANDGLLPREMHEEIYWANFYAHTHYDSGSTFFDFVSSRDDTPGTVLDIGCGDGRDSFAFGMTGRKVIGMDRSHIAVAHAAKKAAQLGVGDLVRFRGIDVSDTETLSAALRDVLDASPDAPVLFYLRFFLHSIPEAVQKKLFAVIDAHARPGDLLAAEFRTDQDEARTKVHHKHYRRYQNGSAFGESLNLQYGFDLLHEQEGTGLSPYHGEDPMLYRVVARRR